MAPSSVVPRLVAGLLLVLWAGLAAVLIVGYRAGSPSDVLVGASLAVPCLAAAAALAWPQVRSAAGVRTLVPAVIGLLSSLLLAPLLIDAGVIVWAGLSLAIVPPPDTAYAGLLALGGTCYLACSGLAHRSTRVWPPTRAVLAGTIALTVLGGLAFGASVSAARGWLDDHPALASAWGPTDPGLVPPTCQDAPALGPGASIAVEATATIDGMVVGTARIEGERAATDERWSGRLDSRFGSGDLAYTRVGPVAWWSVGEAPPVRIAAGLRLSGPDSLTLDGPLAELAADPGELNVAQDLGFDLVEGAPARHCRVAIDGDTVLRASVILRWLAGQDPRMPSTALSVWRGQFDWWIFGDGQLGRAAISVGGYPGDAWETGGIAARLEADLRALHRDASHEVVPPAS